MEKNSIATKESLLAALDQLRDRVMREEYISGEIRIKRDAALMSLDYDTLTMEFRGGPTTAIITLCWD